MKAHPLLCCACILVLTIIQGELLAQGSDLLVLRKGESKTLKTYLAGSQIAFKTASGLNVNGTIRKIDRDTLFISIYDERPAYNPWGTRFWDTVSVSLTKFHYKEITEIPKPVKGFGFVKNGWLFMLGGSAYAVLHSVNAAYLKEPIDPLTLGISVGTALTGFALNRIYRHSIRLGKKYHLQYIPVK
jgi:hypothetical protein